MTFRGAFAGRLDHLARTVPRRDGRRWSNAAIAQELLHRGVRCSEVHLSNLRRGVRDNPSAALVGALADVFDVPVAYFYGQADIELRCGRRCWHSDGAVGQDALTAYDGRGA